MGDGRRRAALTAWLANDLPTRFAERWDELMAESRRSGVALFAMDGFIAATTLAKKLDAGHAQPQRFRVIRRRAVQPMGRMSFVELHRLKYGPKLWVRHSVASRAIAAS